MYEYRIINYGDHLEIHKVHFDGQNITGMDESCVSLDDLSLELLRTKSIEALSALTKPELPAEIFAYRVNTINVSTALDLLRNEK